MKQNNSDKQASSSHEQQQSTKALLEKVGKSKSEPQTRKRLQCSFSNISYQTQSEQCDYTECTNTNAIHKHHHFETGPHLHDKRNARCFSCASGIDPNRTHRYYFTNKLTPVRVYVYYDTKLNIHKSEIAKDEANENDSIFSSARHHTVRLLPIAKIEELPVSSKFYDDALTMAYNSKTKSFVPLMREQI